MPDDFLKCVSGGGKVITKTLSDGRFIRICYPRGGGSPVAGEVKRKLGNKLKEAVARK